MRSLRDECRSLRHHISTRDSPVAILRKLLDVIRTEVMAYSFRGSILWHQALLCLHLSILLLFLAKPARSEGNYGTFLLLRTGKILNLSHIGVEQPHFRRADCESAQIPFAEHRIRLLGKAVARRAIYSLS